jgi:hypothetical protein
MIVMIIMIKITLRFLWGVSNFLDHVKLLFHSCEALKKKGILEMRWIVFISWSIFKVCTFNRVRDVTLLNYFKKKISANIDILYKCTNFKF